MVVCIVMFFFSSRRRHTRYWRDWSSDVCSSDLTFPVRPVPADEQQGLYDRIAEVLDDSVRVHMRADVTVGSFLSGGIDSTRSEERRVGKECRSRWSPYH